MSVTVRELAELLQGSIYGDHEIVVRSARTPLDAQAGDVTFLDDPKRAATALRSRANVVVVPCRFAVPGKTLIQADDPLLAFAAIFQHLQGKPARTPIGIDPGAVIHASAQIGADPHIEALVVIGENTRIGHRCRLHAGVVIGRNCQLGDDVTLFPRAVVYDDAIIGNGSIIHAKAVLGADGFGYHFQDGCNVKVPQLGNVVLGRDVEVGAHTTIDRGTFASTAIGAGAKIDNLTQIAHNCQIGEHNMLGGQVGIAGSTSTGTEVILKSQAGVKDHIKIGDGATLGFKSGLIEDVPAGERRLLYPAREESEAVRIIACIKELPRMRKELLRILKELQFTQGRGNKPPRATEAA